VVKPKNIKKPNFDRVGLANQLKTIRSIFDLSQREVALVAGLSIQQYRRIEQSKTDISAIALTKIIVMCQILVEELDPKTEQTGGIMNFYTYFLGHIEIIDTALAKTLALEIKDKQHLIPLYKFLKMQQEISQEPAESQGRIYVDKDGKIIPGPESSKKLFTEPIIELAEPVFDTSTREGLERQEEETIVRELGGLSSKKKHKIKRKTKKKKT